MSASAQARLLPNAAVHAPLEMPSGPLEDLPRADLDAVDLEKRDGGFLWDYSPYRHKDRLDATNRKADAFIHYVGTVTLAASTSTTGSFT